MTVELSALFRRRLGQVVELGNRFAGGPGEGPCQEFLVRELASAGLENVRLEEFSFPAYRAGPTFCSVLPDNRRLRCVGLQGTTPGTVEAHAVFLGRGEEEDFDRCGELDGRIAVTASKMITLTARHAAERGAAGVVQLSSAPGGYITHGLATAFEHADSHRPLDHWLLAVPGVSVEAEDGVRLLARMSAEPVTLRIEHGAEYAAVRGANVLGELPGRVPGTGEVVIGAHYDNQADGVGAWDNASGLAALLAIAEATTPSRRRISFVAFGAEEQGMWGSAAHVAARGETIGDVVAMINLDTVGSPVDCPRLLCASPELIAGAADASAEAGWRADDVVDAAAMPWFDHGPFVSAGVPSCLLLQNELGHPYYHTAGDEPGLLDMQLAELAVGATAAILERVAALPGSTRAEALSAFHPRRP